MHSKLTHITCLVALCAWPTVARTQLAAAGAARPGPAGMLHSPPVHITGHLVDAANVPIADATVRVTGTTITAQTNRDGEFALVVPAGATSLLVQRQGFIAAQIPLASEKVDYSIVLARDVLQLQSVVLSGPVTTVSPENAAVAIGTVVVQDATQPPPPRLETLIEGAVPGATIESSTSDAPGEGMQLQLRGATTVFDAASPLYVMDGVLLINQPGENPLLNGRFPEGNGINRVADIDPDDIARIEILKGAAATSIYGSKAAAGAVIITTKRGTHGQPHWEIDGEIGHYSLANEFPVRQFPTLRSAQAWYLEDVTHDSTAQATASDDALIQGMYAGPENYQTQLFGNTRMSYLGSVSASGMLGGTQYYVSALSKYDNGVLLNTGDDKQSVRGNITQHIGSRFFATANLNYISDVTRQGYAAANPYGVMTYTPGFVDLDQAGPNGTFPHNPFGPSNPFADAVEISAPLNTSRFIAGGSIGLTVWRSIHQSVEIQATGGADRADLHDRLLVPPNLESQESQALPGLSVTNVGRISYSNYAGHLTHHYAGDWIDATTSVGYSTDREANTNPVTIAQNLLTGVSTPVTGTVESEYFEQTHSLQHSFYAQEQVITLASKLALTAGVTAENSTLNGNTKEFYPYPHYSASYRLLHPFAIADEVKFRVAYGTSGNLAPYGAAFTAYQPTIIEGGNGVYAGLGEGPQFKPEVERETELGFDMPMFHARAQLSATVYQRRISDLVVESSINQQFGPLFFNGGAFSNYGAELEVQATPVLAASGLTWTSTATFYRNYSVVDALAVPQFNASPNYGLGDNLVVVGRSLTELVNPGRAAANGLPLQLGDIMPSYEMSFGNTVSFHNVRVFALADWSRGGTATDLLGYYFDFSSLTADSALAARQRASLAAGGMPFAESATYFTLRQVVLSYSLPARIVDRVGFGRLTSVRLNLSGYDLWSTFTYKGLDPQAGEFGNVSSIGFEPTPYPPARSYYLGVALSI
jgi:TonB-dependent SusC/RagA subfamily outer membrane receptor